ALRFARACPWLSYCAPSALSFDFWCKAKPRIFAEDPRLKVYSFACMSQARETLEQVFREEYGRITATLIRISGSFDLAEESLQEAIVSAAATWNRDGVPRNPGAWLTTVAHRKLLDAIRRERTRDRQAGQLEYEAQRLQPESVPQFEESVSYPDDRLRLIFTCCHPALSEDAQVALTLR